MLLIYLRQGQIKRHVVDLCKKVIGGVLLKKELEKKLKKKENIGCYDSRFDSDLRNSIRRYGRHFLPKFFMT